MKTKSIFRFLLNKVCRADPRRIRRVHFPANSKCTEVPNKEPTALFHETFGLNPQTRWNTYPWMS